MRLFTVLGAALAAVSAGDAGIVSGAWAVQSGSVSIDSRDDADEIDCSRVRIDFGDGPVARDERRLDVARASVDALRVGARNGGISVRGWDGTDYRIVACIAATGADEAEARQRLAGVTLDAHDGRLSVGEPESGQVVAHLHVRAPRGGRVDAETRNGPVSVRAYEGEAQLRATNGPIRVAGARGRIDATAVNGPISVEDSGGQVKATTANGPISVVLNGTMWEGDGLDARATNGPLTLEVPDDYASGVEVSMSRRSPVSCRSPLCPQEWRERSLDHSSMVSLGSGPVLVRLGTINGPVDIQRPGGDGGRRRRHARE